MSEPEEIREARSAGREQIEMDLLQGNLDLKRETDRLEVMGEPTRFTILYLLTTEGAKSSGELADLLDRQQNDLYHHLNRLEDAGLVGKYREGGSRIYELSPLSEKLVPPILESIQDRAII